MVHVFLKSTQVLCACDVIYNHICKTSVRHLMTAFISSKFKMPSVWNMHFLRIFMIQEMQSLAILSAARSDIKLLGGSSCKFLEVDGWLWPSVGPVSVIGPGSGLCSGGWSCSSTLHTGDGFIFGRRIWTWLWFTQSVTFFFLCWGQCS